jgi:hypothetical protein
MDVGGALTSLNMWILVFYARLEIQILIHIFRGSSYTHGSKILSYDLILFVSSKCVVINHQKGRDCKRNQALLWILVIMTTYLED